MNYKPKTIRTFIGARKFNESRTIYKEAGLSLEAIAEILDSSGNHLSKILEQRLENLNSEK